MAVAKRKEIVVETAQTISAQSWSSFAGAPAGKSAVRDLQADLERRLTATSDGRWSGRRTLGFIVLTCGTFWACVAALVLAI
jgi:hypothetical protein